MQKINIITKSLLVAITLTTTLLRPAYSLAAESPQDQAEITF